jgi:hypothetical protein
MFPSRKWPIHHPRNGDCVLNGFAPEWLLTSNDTELCWFEAIRPGQNRCGALPQWLPRYSAVSDAMLINVQMEDRSLLERCRMALGEFEIQAGQVRAAVRPRARSRPTGLQTFHSQR